MSNVEQQFIDDMAITGAQDCANVYEEGFENVKFSDLVADQNDRLVDDFMEFTGEVKRLASEAWANAWIECAQRIAKA